ncbi:MAG TPA: helix-turn-helix domain-containing protein [Gaiellaceae bacterium]|nr:helix-turn-helix domain-containing protein [Gaiellaceae bacterium]
MAARPLHRAGPRARPALARPGRRQLSSELVRRPAAEALRPHVHGYWGYVDEPGVPTRQREALGTHVVLIFGLGSELRVDGVTLSTFVGGVGDACPVIEHDGAMRGIQVDVTPLAARMLLGVPMHELARRSLPLGEVLGAAAGELDARLDESCDWEERFAVVESWLARSLAAAPEPPPDVAWAWNRLRATDGRARVEELAATLGCSRKHLAARFRDHVGLPPKLVARTMRFRRAAELVAGGRPLDEVAAACGYYDHSHLDRDFRDFAATTPSAYRDDPRAQVTFFQDGERRAA